MAQVSLEPSQAINEKILEEDKEILDPEHPWLSDCESEGEVQPVSFEGKDDVLDWAVGESLITSSDLPAVISRSPSDEVEAGLSGKDDKHSQDDLSDEEGDE